MGNGLLLKVSHYSLLKVAGGTFSSDSEIPLPEAFSNATGQIAFLLLGIIIILCPVNSSTNLPLSILLKDISLSLCFVLGF